MNNLNILLNPISKDVFLRFPIVFFFIVSTFIFAVFENHSIYVFEEDIQERVLFYFVVSIPFFTSLYLFTEKRKKSKNYAIFFTIFSIIVLYHIIYSSLDSFVFLFIASIISLMFSAFLSKNSNNNAIFDFNLHGLYSISFAFLSSAILALGILAIVASLDFLFSFSFFKDNLEDIYLFISTVIFPTLILSHIPKEYEIYKESIEIKKALLILIKNILTPLVFIYTLILYAYFIKIVFLYELPKGEMSWIISIYLCLAIFLKIFLSVVMQKNLLLTVLDKNFLITLILPVAFLGLAIYTRIEQYGITEPRYALIVLFLWFISIFVFTIFKRQFCIKTSFASLFTLLLFASLSPFNATNVSTKSQISRFENILLENEMLKDNQLLANKKDLSFDTRVQVSSIVSYFTNTQAKKDFFNNYFDTNFKNQDEVLRYLNVKYASESSKNSEDFYLPIFNLHDIALPTKGYDFVVNLNLAKDKKSIFYEQKSFDIELKDNKIFIDLEENLFEVDLALLLENLKEKKIQEFNKDNYKELLIVQNKKSSEIKLLIKYFSTIKKNKKDMITYIEAVLFVKK
ncbi:DUF4153 domain-containing protein [Arcobacter roscoffensis]|uniref:DUF4153 domain-containing protein n=1 Tax=Arcobacter roscoffensis TaxID=2961520 RepID=A0ABY5E5L3_9BACT|nr:DUF4153 domain-containing protein [Arcobacter roscoffensis]UTJ06433.1 DUF4153 domain-containing protein [Arcobacter roscoffensis]